MIPHLGDGDIQFYRPFVKKLFLYANDRTHVINVVVLVVKITI
jgi:hypothetical protein